MGHLLLVYDDPDLILAQINRVFDASHRRIEVARTGAEAIRRVAERAPKVVELDRMRRLGETDPRPFSAVPTPLDVVKLPTLRVGEHRFFDVA